MPMPVNLPLNMGNSRPLGNTPNISKIGVPTNIGRAQSTSIGRLNQRTDRDNARVSMNQIMSAKAEARGEKTTSINRVGSLGTTAHTSVSRYQTNIKTSANDNSYYDPNQTSSDALDEQRYTYVRRLVKARKAKERALEAAAKQTSGPLSVKTGSSFTHGGASGFHKQMGKFFRSHRTQFGHLKSDQKAVLEKTIEGKLAHKTTGSSVSRMDKLAMKRQINQARSTGKINYRTSQQFKKIIGKL